MWTTIKKNWDSGYADRLRAIVLRYLEPKKTMMRGEEGIRRIDGV